MSAWLNQRFHADCVDAVTEPGPDGLFSRSQYSLIESIRRRMDISVNAHGSRVVAHHDCAGNPVERDQHLRDLACALRCMGSWHLPVRLLGLFVNERWQVELIWDTGGSA
ncbi:MAG TPA: hypothetical protein PLL20_08965 [Phycisphaerae bacterium]|nr:hypothetical protein [Phycisphaerae bacterium]HRR87251.1 hypothetical protein [Phycisphaerae bacterium]